MFKKSENKGFITGEIPRTSVCMKLLAMALLCVGLIVSAVPALAASSKAVLPGTACKSGKYIYYAYEMSGVRMGIMRYNTKTKTKKQITGYKKNGGETNGFYSLNLKGKYIYAEWDQAYGSSVSDRYIYRINVKTGAKKKLAKGCSPVVIGNYIYYEQVKMVDDEEDAGTGTIYRMSLSGKNKKAVKSVSSLDGLYACGGKLLYTTSWNSSVLYYLNGTSVSRSSLNIEADADSSETLTSGGYKYYTVDSGSYSNYRTTLYRQKLSTGKTSKIATFRNIYSFRVCGNYLMVKGTTGSSSKIKVYCMKTNGKSKKRLASWNPAE